MTTAHQLMAVAVVAALACGPSSDGSATAGGDTLVDSGGAVDALDGRGSDVTGDDADAARDGTEAADSRLATVDGRADSGPTDGADLDGASDARDSGVQDSGVQDSGGGPAPDASPSVPCPAYSGLGPEGSARVYRQLPASGTQHDATWTTTEVTETSPGVWRVVVEVEEDVDLIDPEQPDYHRSMRYEYRCDHEGAWWVSLAIETRGSDGAPVIPAQVSTAEGWFLQPWDVAPGSSWVTGGTRVTTFDHPDIDPITTTWSETATVSGPVEVTVPAGTFDTLRFTIGESAVFNAPIEGNVRSATDELLSFDP